MCLKLMHRSFQIVIDGCIFLVQVLQANQRVVLQLVAVVIVGDIGIVMKVSVGVGAVGSHEHAVVVERSEFPSSVVVGMVVGPIDDHLNAIAVGCRNQVVERRPRIRAATKMLLDSHKVARVVSVIRG